MQLSLKSIILTSIYVAVICSLFTAVPEEIFYLGLLSLSIIFPGVLISMMVFDAGVGRAFAVGALPTFVFFILALVSTELVYNTMANLKGIIGGGMVMIALGGGIAMAICEAANLDRNTGETIKIRMSNRISQLAVQLVLTLLFSGLIAIVAAIVLERSSKQLDAPIQTKGGVILLHINRQPEPLDNQIGGLGA